MGTYATFISTPSMASSAAFRAWGKALSDQLTAMGLLLTADTGQIDWATATTPAVVSTAAGYEIRSFNDALSAIAPIIMKIEYGCGTTLATPMVWITVGSASNGAGTLASAPGDSGAVTVRQAISSVATTFTTTEAITRTWVDSDGSAFGVMLWPAYDITSTSRHSGFFGIERWRDAAGNALSDGWTLYMVLAGAASLTGIQEYKAKGVLFPNAGPLWLRIPSISQSGMLTARRVGSIYPHPVLTATYGRSYGASNLICIVGPYDFPAHATFKAVQYGVERTYVAFGPGLANGGGIGINPTGSMCYSFAMRAD